MGFYWPDLKQLSTLMVRQLHPELVEGLTMNGIGYFFEHGYAPSEAMAKAK
jgi:hypothetical protein